MSSITSSLKLFLFIIMALTVLSACGQTPTPISQQASLTLNIKLSDTLARQQAQTHEHAVTNPVTNPSTPPNSSHLIVYGDGFERISAEDASLKSGQLEPEQTIRAFDLDAFNTDALDADALNASNGELAGHLKLLQSERLWSRSKGAGVTVAVIDSGVDVAHPSLQDALLDGYDFICDCATVQATNHGSAVAALVAGRGYGLAPEAKLLPLTVLDEHGEGSSYDLIRALLFAANLLPEQPNPHKADIITLSLGTESYSAAVHEAVRQVAAAGVVLIAATGNADAQIAYPAAFEEVIAVGAGELVGGLWRKADYSNYGNGLDILAPLGGDSQSAWGSYSEQGVLSILSGGGAARFQGTSYAAPQIAGIAALLLASGVGHEQVRDILRRSSSDVGAAGWDMATGYGVVNAAAALRLANVRGRVQGPLTLQLLDPNSLQELSALYTERHARVTLKPGSYRVSFLYDPNFNNELTTTSRVAYRASTPDLLNVNPGDALTLNAVLKPLF